MSTLDPKIAYLTLGWEVNNKQEPKYWVSGWANKNPKAGSQKETDLVRVRTEDMGSHTAIVAQSGSGKSFFLGRLIEELALETKARCVILDPNADFRRLKEVNADLWDEAGFSPGDNKYKVPHEASKDLFLARWNNISMNTRIRTGPAFGKEEGYEQFKFWWPSLAVEFLAEESSPKERSELYHCHTFVQKVATIAKLRFLARPDEQIDLIDIAEDLFAKKDDSKSLSVAINEHFETEDLLNQVFAQESLLAQAWHFLGIEQLPSSAPAEHRKNILRKIVKTSCDAAIKAVKYASRETGTYYFGKAAEYRTEGLIQTLNEAQQSVQSYPGRIEVIDLPSLGGTNARLLAINTVLTGEWERVRREWSMALEKDDKEDTRVPTFIVVDEAHNLLPKDTRTDAETALREQFRQIVAEGRKYGLFLILVTQRPDKLDPLVVSECENKAIMRLGSKSVLKITKEMLGLEDTPLDKALSLQKGRAMLVGRWSPEVRTLYCAARRTVEGGRNLNESHWAVGLESLQPAAEPNPSETAQ